MDSLRVTGFSGLVFVFNPLSPDVEEVHWEGPSRVTGKGGCRPEGRAAPSPRWPVPHGQPPPPMLRGRGREGGSPGDPLRLPTSLLVSLSGPLGAEASSSGVQVCSRDKSPGGHQVGSCGSPHTTPVLLWVPVPSPAPKAQCVRPRGTGSHPRALLSPRRTSALVPALGTWHLLFPPAGSGPSPPWVARHGAQRTAGRQGLWKAVDALDLRKPKSSFLARGPRRESSNACRLTRERPSPSTRFQNKHRGSRFPLPVTSVLMVWGRPCCGLNCILQKAKFKSEPPEPATAALVGNGALRMSSS